MIICLCIPKIEETIKSSYIQKQIQKTKMGLIKQYTELPWKHDPTHKRVLMRMEWNENHPQSAIFQEMLKSGKSISIVHEFPKVWKLFLAKN